MTYPSANKPTIEQQLEKQRKAITYGIYFDFNQDMIKLESEPVLKEIAQAMADRPDWKVTIAGFTDNIGGDKYNLGFSQRRSASVKRALVERYHEDPGRFNRWIGDSSQSTPQDARRPGTQSKSGANVGLIVLNVLKNTTQSRRHPEGLQSRRIWRAKSWAIRSGRLRARMLRKLSMTPFVQVKHAEVSHNRVFDSIKQVTLKPERKITT